MTATAIPLEDTDCTRCQAPVSWGEHGPPEDPDSRICYPCVWVELDERRVAMANQARAIDVLRALADEASKYDPSGAYWLGLAIAKVS